MDRNLHTDEFTRLLREKSDEFRMYPSKRVWYSVYNNIHPSRKWPSVAMTITLITALFLVGYLNTNKTSSVLAGQAQSKSSAGNNASSQFFKPFNEYTAANSSTSATTKYNTINQSNGENKSTVAGSKLSGKGSFKTTILQPETLFATNNAANSEQVTNRPVEATTGSDLLNGSSAGLTVNRFSNSSDKQQSVIVNEADVVVYESDPAALLQSQKLGAAQLTGEEANSNSAENFRDIPADVNPGSGENNIAVEKAKGAAATKSMVISKEDQEWIENYALYNRPLPKKWSGKLDWQLYATPSVVYRTLKNDPAFGVIPSSAPFLIPNSNVDINNDVVQRPSAGLEIGGGIRYAMFKVLKLKTGLQLNYTRYNAMAFHNTHPVAAKLTMHDLTTNSTYELYRTTPYSNKTGLEAVKLHNETFQLSLPVGIDIKILGNEELQWNIGATIQPSYVFGGKSYLISSDRRNYVKESAMINRWNLNAGFETFISYKRNGLVWQIGPQFRRQLLSTNTKNFAVQEQLVNYGIKFGVSKTLW